MGDFEREILSESPPKLGAGAEVLNNEAEKLHRIHVILTGLDRQHIVAIRDSNRRDEHLKLS